MAAENSQMDIMDINDFINRLKFFDQYFGLKSPEQIRQDREANQIFKEWELTYVMFIAFLDGRIYLKSGENAKRWGQKRWEQLPDTHKKRNLIGLAKMILKTRDFYSFAVGDDVNNTYMELIVSNEIFPDFRNRVDSVKAHSKYDFFIGGGIGVAFGLVMGYVSKPYFDRFIGFLRSLLLNRSSDNVRILASSSGESSDANVLQLLGYGVSFVAGISLIPGIEKYKKWKKDTKRLLEIENSKEIIVSSSLKMLRVMPPIAPQPLSALSTDQSSTDLVHQTTQSPSVASSQAEAISPMGRPTEENRISPGM